MTDLTYDTKLVLIHVTGGYLIRAINGETVIREMRFGQRAEANRAFTEWNDEIVSIIRRYGIPSERDRAAWEALRSADRLWDQGFTTCPHCKKLVQFDIPHHCPGHGEVTAVQVLPMPSEEDAERWKIGR